MKAMTGFLPLRWNVWAVNLDDDGRGIQRVAAFADRADADDYARAITGDDAMSFARRAEVRAIADGSTVSAFECKGG